MRILVVEDEKRLAQTLRDLLHREGYTVDVCYSGTEGLDNALSGIYDLMLLDVMLPGLDGFTVLERLRGSGSRLPVLMLTARGELSDRVCGLDRGADYYLTKPFDSRELVACINALLRRAGAFGAADTELCSNGIRVLLLQSQAFKNGEALELTAAEYKLLCLFMHNPNTVLTKGQILDKLWDCDGNYIDSSTLTVYIRRLRMKIEDDPGAPQMLLTVRGMGYKWSVIS